MAIHATVKLTFFIITSIFLCSCSTTHEIIKNSQLSTQTNVSNTIFLDPNTSGNNKVYLQIKNNSGTTLTTAKANLAQKLNSKNLIHTNNLDEAQYLLQVNILQLGLSQPKFAQKSLKTGYGSAIEGAWIGKSIAKASKKDTESIAGLIGASVATTANALVEDNMYTAVIDVQISERLKSSTKESIKSSLPQGKNTKRNITVKQDTDWMRYQTRIVTSVNRINLSLKTALPVLEEQFINSISEII
jgi:hypothetical protein